MIASIFLAITNFVTNTISYLGYGGIVLLMAIESACIPLPSEIIMPFSGFLVAQGRFNLWWTGFYGALGCTVGSIIAYWVGKYGGLPFVYKYGKYFLVTRHDVEMAHNWFEKYGDWAIFFSRLMPVVRTFISLPAGIAQMNFPKFVIYSFVGSFPWCLGLSYVGVVMGQNWAVLKKYFHQFDVVILIVFLIALYWWINRHLKALKEEKQEENALPEKP